MHAPPIAAKKRSRRTANAPAVLPSKSKPPLPPATKAMRKKPTIAAQMRPKTYKKLAKEVSESIKAVDTIIEECEDQLQEEEEEEDDNASNASTVSNRTETAASLELKAAVTAENVLASWIEVSSDSDVGDEDEDESPFKMIEEESCAQTVACS
jgi:hypothetical protein